MSSKLVVHIGIDDTDSPRGGCTTYIASLAIDVLLKLGSTFIDYPNLIRLNPNAPWKTRGNGALCLRFKIDVDKLDIAIKEILKIVKAEADLDHPATNPTVAVLKGWPGPKLKSLAKEAVEGIVKVSEALMVAQEEDVQLYALKDYVGVVGALAAIGNLLEEDYTYELIAYRVPTNRGKPRLIDEQSVVFMDNATRPNTFNNIDLEVGRVLITPRGPDPVLFGIRGENPMDVKSAASLIKVGEVIERWTIFRTNQGTDAHLKHRTIAEAEPYYPVIIKGTIISKPITTEGGHVMFKLADPTGTIDCAAYEPTGSFRKIVLSLLPGDQVEVYGGIRPPTKDHPKTVNLEKIRVLSLRELKTELNPRCPLCGARTKSMGKGKGYRCEKCGKRLPVTARKEEHTIPRNIIEALYIPPPRAQRHLTKPYSRYGREKAPQPFTPSEIPVEEFHWVNPTYKKR